MATQTKQLQSIFPNIPRLKQVIDNNGELTAFWELYFSSLSQALQKNFTSEGILLPNLNASQISIIQSIYTPLIGSPLPQNIPDISGQTIFDSTNRVPKVFIITYDGSIPPNIVTASWKTFVLI